MPTAITLYSVAVWFCVGVVTGAGWALGTWFIGKFTAK